MNELRKVLKLPHGFASFTNLELYYIVSKLFGLGAFGEHFIEKERLYINVSKAHYLKFVFITTIPIVSKEQSDPTTMIYFGEVDEDFEEIEIYGGDVPSSPFRGDKKYIGDGHLISELLKDRSRVNIESIDLVEGLLGIITQSDIFDRKPNDMFDLIKGDKIATSLTAELELFASFDPDANKYKEFSGRYYLVAEPRCSFGEKKQIRGTRVHDYSLSAKRKVNVKPTEIDDLKMKEIEAKYSTMDFTQLARVASVRI